MIAPPPSLDTAEDLLAALLTGTVEALDIPSDLASAAHRRYLDVARHLNQHGDAAGGAPWDVYPQGSFLLGTVTSPGPGGLDYDVDLVLIRQISADSITRVKLKVDAGDALSDYVATAGDLGGPDERGRCWTLDCGDFHLDVLPAVPDEEGGSTAILLTDRDLARWLRSDPKGFARWFRARQERQWVAKAAVLAERRNSTIEDIPPPLIKTTLQQGVQFLKRHRDIFFKDDTCHRPPSILITTLAAHAYAGEDNLYQAVLNMADKLPEHVERDGGDYVVANPVHPAENFADKWKYDDVLPERFFAWTERLRRDLTEVGHLEGLDSVAASLRRSLGDAPVIKAAESLGLRYRDAREQGSLVMGLGSGTLGTSVTPRLTRPVRDHTFFGDETST